MADIKKDNLLIEVSQISFFQNILKQKKKLFCY